MRRFNTLTQRWDYVQRYRHDGQAWLEVIRGDADDAVVLTSAFDHDADRYLGKGTVLQRDISQMPIDPDSDAYAQFMWDWTPFTPAGGWGSKTSLNTSAYGTQPIHMYLVDSTNPDCEFTTFGSSSTSISTPQVEVDTYMRGPIPKASWMVPAQNGDRGLAIYDVGTGIMREWFMATQSADGTWGGGGGYSITTPGLRDLATTNYALQQRRGISNVAGMHNSLGFIGIAEALNKKVEHALCFTAGALRMNHWNADRTPIRTGSGDRISWPSRASDGKLENYLPGGSKYNAGNTTHQALASQMPITPTHGQWGRLKGDVDPMYDPRTGRPYNELTRVLIEAAKKYGLVATDTNLWCNAFNAEQGRTWAHVYGQDPWASGGIIEKAYTDRYGINGYNVSDFPWDRTEWAPLDWGRPSPDFNLRPGQLVHWVRA